jgi:tRNA G18 (ribose-2'-O)-methylase SpoU
LGDLPGLAAIGRWRADRDESQRDRRLSAAALPPPAFILVGNEAQGLPEAYEAECDTLVKIPMLGKADSLNAAVATAVMAYEVLNQWRRA